MGWAEHLHTGTRDGLTPRRRGLGNAFPDPTSQSVPSLHVAPGTKCCVVYRTLVATAGLLLQASTTSQTALFFLSHLPHGLAHRCSISVYWTKEGNSDFTFQDHSNFYVKTAEPIQGTLISKKSRRQLTNGSTKLLWVPWWDTCIFFTLSYSWSLSLDSVDVSLQLCLTPTQTFLS